MLPEESKKKSFWQRPEGTTGMIFMAIGGVALYAALPTLLVFMTGLVALLGKTIAAVALASVLGGIFYLATNKRVRTLVSYMFRSAMRKVTGLFVEIDPIGIMKSYIEDLVKKREQMGEARGQLSGQITLLKKQILTNAADYERAVVVSLEKAYWRWKADEVDFITPVLFEGKRLRSRPRPCDFSKD